MDLIFCYMTSMDLLNMKNAQSWVWSVRVASRYR